MHLEWASISVSAQVKNRSVLMYSHIMTAACSWKAGATEDQNAY